MTLRDEPHRERPRRGNAAVEFRDHAALAQLLEQFCHSHWRYTHLPFGELRSKATAGKLKAMGVTRGWPDFMFVGPGRTCFLELKRRTKGRVSREQGDLAGHLMACGCGYGMTSSVDDAVDMLKAWGVIPQTVNLQ